ncbi:unnamed protein product [Mycena citricolor]|uniref:Uncharacterized protein n=1 Tax=Mycena citricolor TaxID=2018698 RepID=A0AAD2HTC9_9AGAR|nr:unnamed protein product [Mycena citricolor]
MSSAYQHIIPGLHNEAIHDPTDAVQSTDTMKCDTPPDHDTPTTMFDLLFGVAWVVCLSQTSPAPFPPIRPKNIELRLIGEDDGAPVLPTPITMVLRPIQTLPDVLTLEQRLVLLNKGPQALCLEALADCVNVKMGEELALQVCRVLGLARREQLDSAVAVLVRELTWATRLGPFGLKIVGSRVSMVDAVDRRGCNILLVSYITIAPAQALEGNNCGLFGWSCVRAILGHVCVRFRGER